MGNTDEKNKAKCEAETEDGKRTCICLGMISFLAGQSTDTGFTPCVPHITNKALVNRNLVGGIKESYWAFVEFNDGGFPVNGDNNHDKPMHASWFSDDDKLKLQVVGSVTALWEKDLFFVKVKALVDSLSRQAFYTAGQLASKDGIEEPTLPTKTSKYQWSNLFQHTFLASFIPGTPVHTKFNTPKPKGTWTMGLVYLKGISIPCPLKLEMLLADINKTTRKPNILQFIEKDPDQEYKKFFHCTDTIDFSLGNPEEQFLMLEASIDDLL